MAQKSGGGWFWLILGILAGVALTLAALMFLNAGSGDGADGRTAADDAAAAAQAPDQALPAPVEPEKKSDPVPVPRDAGLDPASDDQIADDAAASGMTSRTPPPSTDGE
ncbi:MAG: hypothetical protein Q8L23_11585 [Caulobacter sp.]|nr:hypothetical protein [Caulobacter sp.]